MNASQSRRGQPLIAAAPMILAVVLAATTAQAAPGALAAWSRPAAKGTTAVGFLTLVNPGPKADALVSIETPAARQVQIHQSSVSGGMASMQMVSKVPLATGARVVFAPGGYHLMFLNLAESHKVGDTLPATLVFASGVRLKTRFVVRLSAPKETPAFGR